MKIARLRNSEKIKGENNKMFLFIIGLFIGVFIGITIMCLLQMAKED